MLLITFKQTETANFDFQSQKKGRKRIPSLVVGLFTLGEKHKNTSKFKEGLCSDISAFLQERYHIGF